MQEFGADVSLFVPIELAAYLEHTSVTWRWLEKGVLVERSGEKWQIEKVELRKSHPPLFECVRLAESASNENPDSLLVKKRFNLVPFASGYFASLELPEPAAVCVAEEMRSRRDDANRIAVELAQKEERGNSTANSAQHSDEEFIQSIPRSPTSVTTITSRSRKISPPIDSLSSLRQPLTLGELKVLRFFDTYLDSAWEIYIQPHLNGLRPDFVLLHPNRGIAVFEIKDWDVSAVRYHYRASAGRYPILMAERDGKGFRAPADPFQQVANYKKEIYELYCPRIRAKAGLGAITAGVIFTTASEDVLHNIFTPGRDALGFTTYPNLYPFTGQRSLESGRIDEIFPRHQKDDDRMSEELAADLRNWLEEPLFQLEQRRPIDLDSKQDGLARGSVYSGYRRIRGPAGSGKSHVLAVRAAELAIKYDAKVMVISFNRTLVNYLRDLVAREGGGTARNKVEWVTFHWWCKRVAYQTGYLDEYTQLFAQFSNDEELDNHNDECVNAVLQDQLPNAVIRWLSNSEASAKASFDAVLIDEGQDFLPSWWKCLRQLVRPGGEMMLVADRTQNLYQTAKRWTDDVMTDAGFVGRWNELSGSYRIPSSVLQLAQKLAESLPADSDVNISMNAKGVKTPSELAWTQVEPSANLVAYAVHAVKTMMQKRSGSVSDICILVDDRSIGMEMVDLLKVDNIDSTHTFSRLWHERQKIRAGSRKLQWEENEAERRAKHAFRQGDARIKITTVHSFKGWESSAIILIVSGANSEKKLAELYVGVTRLRADSAGSFLSIICNVPELAHLSKYMH